MECLICCEKNNESSINLECSHSFHKICLIKWVETKLGNGPVNCPCCRREFREDITDDESVKIAKRIHKMRASVFSDMIKNNNDSDFEKIRKSEYSLEIAKVYSPLLYKFLILPKEEFKTILDTLVEIEEQTEKRTIAKMIKDEREREEKQRLAAIAIKMMNEEHRRREVNQDEFIINPNTGRKIKIGGKTYRLLTRGEQL